MTQILVTIGIVIAIIVAVWLLRKRKVDTIETRVYRLGDAFTANKTAVNSGSCTDGSATLLGWFAGARTDADSVRVISSSANDPSSVSDDVLLNTYVKIIVDR